MAARGSVLLVGDDVAIYCRADIVTLLNERAMQKEVAAYIGVSDSTLTRFMQKQGITRSAARFK